MSILAFNWSSLYCPLFLKKRNCVLFVTKPNKPVTICHCIIMRNLWIFHTYFKQLYTPSKYCLSYWKFGLYLCGFICKNYLWSTDFMLQWTYGMKWRQVIVRSFKDPEQTWKSWLHYKFRFRYIQTQEDSTKQYLYSSSSLADNQSDCHKHLLRKKP